jgi:hypothetical protein
MTIASSSTSVQSFLRGRVEFLREKALIANAVECENMIKYHLWTGATQTVSGSWRHN